MKTEELIKELKLSIHEGITALDPLAKELLREYKMQQLVYDWSFELAKNNIVLISSYEISDARFEEVYSFDKARSTLQSGCHKSKCEKLFMVK